jgi:glycine/D-amino acid oxidase-like deaminating enzyme
MARTADVAIIGGSLHGCSTALHARPRRAEGAGAAR